MEQLLVFKRLCGVQHVSVIPPMVILNSGFHWNCANVCSARSPVCCQARRHGASSFGCAYINKKRGVRDAMASQGSCWLANVMYCKVDISHHESSLSQPWPSYELIWLRHGETCGETFHSGASCGKTNMTARSRLVFVCKSPTFETRGLSPRTEQMYPDICRQADGLCSFASSKRR